MKFPRSVLAFLPILSFASAENLLLLGDAYVSLKGDLWGCSDSGKILDVQNDTEEFLTAAEMASKGTASKSFKDNDFDYVWLSIGGSDFLSRCDAKKEEDLAEDILSIISDIVESSSNDNIKILYHS